MTARDFIASLAPVDLDRQSRIFRYLADHAFESRLRDGAPIRDVTDFRMWLAELAEAAELRKSGQSTTVSVPAEIRPCRKVMGTFGNSDPCPRCGHVHQGSAECGEEIGGGRICRCELEVRA